MRDPLTATKASVNMIVQVFDNDILGKHLNNMTWGVIDVGRSPYRFLLSDRAAVFANLNSADGVVYLPIGPTKIFVAVSTPDRLQQLRKLPPPRHRPQFQPVLSRPRSPFCLGS